MIILTNFMDAPPTFELLSGRHAKIVRADSWPQLRMQLSEADLIIVDCRDLVIYKFAVLFLLFPWKRRPLAAVDLVLRKPLTLRHRLTALAKRLLLMRVDHFVHYFRDLSGYTKFFGVPASRSSYVPFKSNLCGIQHLERPSTEVGDYIFAMGVSLRDYDTFIRAIALLPYPAAIPRHSFENFEGRPRRYSWSLENLPPNLSILPDDGNREELINNIAKAKVVVIPIQGHSLCASGISTYLDAMYLGKCVVMTAGPGASDLLTDQAILVRPHDVEALRSAMHLAWTDKGLRNRTAKAGLEYALNLGDEARLLDRIFRQCILALGADRC